MELAAEILPYGISCCAVYLGCKVEQARQDEKKRLSKAENKISSLEKKVRANKKLIDKLSQNGDDMKFKIDLTGDTVRNTEDTLSKKFAHYDKMIHTCTTISTKTADVSRDRLRNMKDRLTKMQAKMDEIITRANTPSVIPVEEEAQEITERSCLSGGRGQQHHFESWCQPLEMPVPTSMLSVSARAAPVAVMPVCSARLEPLNALEWRVTPLTQETRIEWAKSLGSPLSTPVKVIASFFKKMTTRSTDVAQETKES